MRTGLRPHRCMCDAGIALEEISRLVHEFTLDPDGFRKRELESIRQDMLRHGITPRADSPPRSLDSYPPQYRRYHELCPDDGPVSFVLTRIHVTALGVLQADELGPATVEALRDRPPTGDDDSDDGFPF